MFKSKAVFSDQVNQMLLQAEVQVFQQYLSQQEKGQGKIHSIPKRCHMYDKFQAQFTQISQVHDTLRNLYFRNDGHNNYVQMPEDMRASYEKLCWLCTSGRCKLECMKSHVSMNACAICNQRYLHTPQKDLLANQDAFLLDCSRLLKSIAYNQERMELKDSNTLNLITSKAREIHIAKAFGLAEQTELVMLPIIRGTILKLIVADNFCFQRIKLRLVNELKSLLEATNFIKVDLENLIQEISR